MNLDRRALAETRFDEALGLFTALGDAAGMADIVDARAMTAFGNGDITTGIEEFDRAAKLFTDSGNLLRVVTPQSTQGHGLMFAGRPRDGLAETCAALELARRLGYAEGEAMVLWHHAEVLVGCGAPAEALLARRGGPGPRAASRAPRVDGHDIARRWASPVPHWATPPGAVAAFEESLRISGEHLTDVPMLGARQAGDGAARPGPSRRRCHPRR